MLTNVDKSVDKSCSLSTSGCQAVSMGCLKNIDLSYTCGGTAGQFMGLTSEDFAVPLLKRKSPW